jgi:hypothetical protein
VLHSSETSVSELSVSDSLALKFTALSGSTLSSASAAEAEESSLSSILSALKNRECHSSRGTCCLIASKPQFQIYEQISKQR